MRAGMPVLGALLLVASQAFGQAQDLCYSMRVAGAGGITDYEFKPVTGFPASHAVVANQFCGRQFQPGEAIPGGNSMWGGGINSNEFQCQQNINSGAFFYAYNSPNGSSSNTGFEQSDAVIVYFVVDDAGVMSLVLTFDSVYDGSGGTVKMSIDAPDLVGKDITFGLRDDSTEPRCSGSMCQWDSSTAQLTDMTWVWASCCTDGMALNNLPTNGESIPFSFNAGTSGIERFKIAQWNNDTLTPDFIDLDAQQVLSSGFVVRAETCGAFCGTKTSCGECSLDRNCQWCDGTSACVSNNQAAEQTCPDGGFNDGSQCCADCSAHDSCGDCGDAPGCAWDFASSVCLSAKYADVVDLNGTVTCAEPDPEFLATTAAECAACPGAIYNGTDLVDWCLSNGECDWPSRTCDCDYGWFGADCGAECPGGAANPCNGHGTCNDGVCFCECGWSGAACNEVGCPCGASSEVPAGMCAIGGCNEVCGVRFADQTCSGSAAIGGPNATESCACLVGWWGEECTNPCPGVNADGTGVVCGGHGTCNAQGQCECTDCHSPDPNAAGICVEDPALTCNNFGSSQCVYTDQGLANETSSIQCVCNGAWTGPTCNTCPCPGAVACNSISGECQYTQCGVGDYTVTPGSLSGDTVCAPITTCSATYQWEVTPPTLTSDRACRNHSAACALPAEWQSAAPTTSSDRQCRNVTDCAAANAYETVAATATSDTVCVALTVCSATQFETAAPTATSDRTCAPLTNCTAAEYISTAASYNSDLLCSNLTVCAEVGVEWQSTAPTTSSDRACSRVRGPCDPELTLDLVETAAPTATTNRACATADDCAGAPCLNGATCVDGIHTYSCTCAELYVGDNCSIFDTCLATPCPESVLCTATDDGAICTCENGQFGKCCDLAARPDPDDTGAICMTVAEGEARLDAATADTATSEASGSLVAIVSCLALLVLIALVVVAKRRKDEKETPEDGNLDIGRSNGLNPMFDGEGPGKASMIGGANTMVGADGKTMRADGSALVNGGGTAIAIGHSGGVEYDMCHNAHGNGSEYSAISGRNSMIADGSTLAARGRAEANMGTEATYDAGAAGADPAYDIGAARGADPTYDVGAARGEAVYDNGAANVEDDPNIYNMAQSNDAPDYALGGAAGIGAARRGDPDDVYNNRQQVEALYGISEEDNDEAVYGLAGSKSDVDPLYGLAANDAKANRSTSDTYANKDDVADPIYGLDGDVKSPNPGARQPSYEHALSGDIYENNAAVSPKPAYEVAAPDGVYGLAADVGAGQPGLTPEDVEDIYNNLSAKRDSVSFENLDFLPLMSDTLLRNAGVDGTLTRTTPSSGPEPDADGPGPDAEAGADADADDDWVPDIGPEMRKHSVNIQSAAEKKLKRSSFV